MKPSDRRSARRYHLQVPLRIQALKSDEPERIVESANLSERDVYFVTDSPYQQGVGIQLFLEMPLQVTGDFARQWKCVGHVVHSRKLTADSSSYGVGVRFDYFETLSRASIEAAS